MEKFDVCDLEEFCTLVSSEKTIAILGDRWWPQTAKQGGDRISKHFLCSTWKKRSEPPNVGGVSVRSGNDALSPKGCVVNGQMTKASNKRVRCPPPPPSRTHQKKIHAALKNRSYQYGKPISRIVCTSGNRLLVVRLVTSRWLKSCRLKAPKKEARWSSTHQRM